MNKKCQSVPVQTSAVFTLSASAVEKFCLDNTPLAPNRVTLLARTQLAQRYYNQLSSLLYNEQEVLDHSALVTITSLNTIVQTTGRPIRLMSQAFHKKLPTLYNVLNDFYKNNKDVIESIAGQLE